MAAQKTLVIVKPHAVELGLANQIFGLIGKAGIVHRRHTIIPSVELAESHYQEHLGKPYYPLLIERTCRGPVIFAVVAGEDVVTVVRTLLGHFDPRQADPASIRGSLSHWLETDTPLPDNFAHASDSPESAQREIALWLGRI